MKGYDADEILERMRRDHESDWHLRILGTMYRVSSQPLPLSYGEIRALNCAAHGLTDRQAADLCGVSFYTVKKQLMMARLRLRAKTTTHADAIAIRGGILP